MARTARTVARQTSCVVCIQPRSRARKWRRVLSHSLEGFLTLSSNFTISIRSCNYGNSPVKMRNRRRCILVIVLSVTMLAYLELKHNQKDGRLPKKEEKSPSRNEGDSFHPRSGVNFPLDIHSRNSSHQAYYDAGYFIGLQNSNRGKIVNPDGRKPIILIWRSAFGAQTTFLANPAVCGGDVDCEVTYDQELLKDSGAVVFHQGSTLNHMPERKAEQLYVWWTGEKNHFDAMLEFDNFFNLTFTYRTDSGIYAPYGSTNLILQELRIAKEFNVDDLLKKKQKSGKIAAWAVSNCGVRRRMELADQIIKAGLEVDTFGRCFGGRKIGAGRYALSFYEALSEYKFYFAFENGYHCKDYITEKFWFNGLRAGAVPIVWGPKKEDVQLVAPTNSFIHVEDYPTVEELVAHLQFLSNNETAYRKYLEWRTWVAHPDLMEERLQPQNRDDDLRSFCKLCRILQEEKEAERRGTPKRRMVVPSMNDFWWKRENKECIRS